MFFCSVVCKFNELVGLPPTKPVNSIDVHMVRAQFPVDGLTVESHIISK